MAQAAEARGFKIMVGSMVGTSLAAAPALLLAQLCRLGRPRRAAAAGPRSRAAARHPGRLDQPAAAGAVGLDSPSAPRRPAARRRPSRATASRRPCSRSRRRTSAPGTPRRPSCGEQRARDQPDDERRRWRKSRRGPARFLPMIRHGAGNEQHGAEMGCAVGEAVQELIGNSKASGGSKPWPSSARPTLPAPVTIAGRRRSGARRRPIGRTAAPRRRRRWPQRCRPIRRTALRCQCSAPNV